MELIKKNGEYTIGECPYCTTENTFTRSELEGKLGKDESTWDKQLREKSIEFECEYFLCGNMVEITSFTIK